MADSRNQPELKTLDYEPDVEWMNVPLGPEPASPPPETLGQNSHDIRPEKRVNKAEPNYYPFSCDKPEQPDPNQQIITEIEGLISQAEKKLGELKAKFSEGEEIYQVQAGHRSRALEEIQLLKDTLRKLKQVFIGVNNDISES